MGAPPADEILLEGLEFYAYHGVNPEERALGQRFVVDVALAVDLRPAGRADDLARTIDYAAVYKRVRAVVEGVGRENPVRYRARLPRDRTRGSAHRAHPAV